MTGRAVKEWIGDTPDTKIPDRVQDRVLRRSPRKCQSCGALFQGQAVEFDHKIALINWTGEGHGNREGNLWAIGAKCCHKEKTRQDVAEKSRAYRKRSKLRGTKSPSKNPVPGSKASPWKRQYNRETGRFETVRRR